MAGNIGYDIHAGYRPVRCKPQPFSIAYQAIKVSMVNPVNPLKSEYAKIYRHA